MPPADIEQLDALLSEPTPLAIETLARLDGDLLLLGVGGKMGPTLARMARRAFDAAGARSRVIGVARFSNPTHEEWLRRHGVETVRCDLLDPAQLERLPDAANVLFMAGMKFGSTGQEALTWAMNCHLPALVAQRFRRSRLVAFSTGNVYGLTPVARGGSVEGDPLAPAGEYAMSCVGRERMFEHFSRSLGTPTALLRLNYANELRYGVLVDVARRVGAGGVNRGMATPRRADWTGLSDEQLLAQCEVDTYRASGPGGQKRNKTSSAVRLRHPPRAERPRSLTSRWLTFAFWSRAMFRVAIINRSRRCARAPGRYARIGDVENRAAAPTSGRRAAGAMTPRRRRLLS